MSDKKAIEIEANFLSIIYAITYQYQLLCPQAWKTTKEILLIIRKRQAECVEDMKSA